MDNLIETITKLIETLDKPQPFDWNGLALVIITAIYVIATVFICIFNHRSAKATKEQVEEQKKQFEETNRPNIDITLEVIRSGLMCLKIENTGKKLAQRVRLKINDDFLENYKGIEGEVEFKMLKNLNQATFNLGVGQKWFAFICSHLTLSAFDNILLEINISYEDEYQTYKNNTTIDFSQYNWMIIYNSPFEDINEQQKKTTSALEKIGGIIKAKK